MNHKLENLEQNNSVESNLRSTFKEVANIVVPLRYKMISLANYLLLYVFSLKEQNSTCKRCSKRMYKSRTTYIMLIKLDQPRLPVIIEHHYSFNHFQRGSEYQPPTRTLVRSKTIVLIRQVDCDKTISSCDCHSNRSKTSMKE